MDRNYDLQFIDGLNSIKNIPCISLAIVTEKPANSVLIYLKNKPVTSTLNIEPLGLGDLTEQEIRLEIGRRCWSHYLGRRRQNQLVSYLLDMPRNYGFIKYIHPKIKAKTSQNLDIKERLKYWQKSFQEEFRSDATKRVSHVTRVMKGWIIILNPFHKAANQLQRMLKGPVSLVRGLLPGRNDQERAP